MTDGSPNSDKYLQWTIEKKDGFFFIKSLSSNCYLDGRGKSGQNVLVTCSSAYYDNKFLKWKIFKSDE